MSFWNIALVDSSASMTSNQDSVNKGIIDLFNDQHDNTDRFTFITFNTVVKNIADANFNEIKCEDIINSILNVGLTALYDAIGHVYKMIIAENFKNVSLTIITDGYENSSKIHTLVSLKTLRETIDEMCNLNVSFICENEHDLKNNTAIISHANESHNTSGDYVEAFRNVSRSMSYARPPSVNQIYSIGNENEIENESMSEPIVKRQQSYAEKKRPRLFF